MDCRLEKSRTDVDSTAKHAPQRALCPRLIAGALHTDDDMLHTRDEHDHGTDHLGGLEDNLNVGRPLRRYVRYARYVPLCTAYIGVT